MAVRVKLGQVRRLVNLDREQWEGLQQLAFAYGCSVSFLLRPLIDQLLEGSRKKDFRVVLTNRKTEIS